MVRAAGCVLGDTHMHAHICMHVHTHMHTRSHSLTHTLTSLLYSHLRAFVCRSFCRECLSLAKPHEPGPTAASCTVFIMFTVFLPPLEPNPQKGV